MTDVSLWLLTSLTVYVNRMIQDEDWPYQRKANHVIKGLVFRPCEISPTSKESVRARGGREGDRIQFHGQ